MDERHIAQPLTPAHEATFDSLILHRIHSILVVASAYDAFIIEEGARLTELILDDYVSLGLSVAPSVTRASTADEALELISRKQFDVVLTLARVGSMDAPTFGDRIKSIDAKMPVVLLVFDADELRTMITGGPHPGIDEIFVWQGDSKLFLAVIKMIEDRWNVDHDTSVAQVRTILLVEDSIPFASRYLPLLYEELLEHTQTLLHDGVNLTQRLLRMRARPKVLWARDYEEAIELYERHRKYMLGVITDLVYPRKGQVEGYAGVELVRRIQSDDPTLPILLQSSLAEGPDLADELGVAFLNKRSRKLLKSLRRFIEEQFGFGDFVFLMPDGSEWGRAQHLRELSEKLVEVPNSSLAYHSKRNDFSNWLRARTEFSLAKKIRPRKIEEFGSMDALREYLIDVLQQHIAETQRGEVVDFSPSRFDATSEFVRIGQGSLGGKGRGLAFANRMLQRSSLQARFPDVRIAIPPTAVLATDIFDTFLKENELIDVAYGHVDDDALLDAFRAAHLPEQAHDALDSFLRRITYPLAVRSSSLLEDSQTHPFAGIYRTYMVPNNHPDVDVRREQLARAIKLVYASMFSARSKAYLESTPYRIEDEKMAVVLQRVVGSTHGSRYYPHLSGVGRSYNFYPIPPMTAGDGIVLMALGLGPHVMEGGKALRFSPTHPRHLPQFGTVSSTLENAQQRFCALDLSRPDLLPDGDEHGGLLDLDVDIAVDDGVHHHLISTYSHENDTIHDGHSRSGHPVVTFAPLLKSESYPLAAILRSILDMGREGMAGPVEMEFAMDLSGGEAWFGLLQMRHLVMGDEAEEIALDFQEIEDAVCYSGTALGNGNQDGVVDLLYVRPDRFDAAHSRKIAAEVGDFSHRLRNERRSFVLIGPGRWGSSDPWLGIPVTWEQIAGACTIVEATLEDFRVEPSQGTHFFHNLTSLGIGYLTVNPFLGKDRLDWDWLADQPPVSESEFVRHLRFDRPLRVRIDGRSGRGLILPAAPLEIAEDIA